MTNRDMVKGTARSGPAVKPDAPPLPPMPAPEDAAGPTTRDEPIDSPQPNASVDRDPPSADKGGLATKR